jgi:hypothetical protein
MIVLNTNTGFAVRSIRLRFCEDTTRIGNKKPPNGVMQAVKIELNPGTVIRTNRGNNSRTFAHVERPFLGVGAKVNRPMRKRNPCIGF